MKYVGFDCDECLAQVEQIMPFTTEDADEEVFDFFADKLAGFPFIRPTFWPLLEAINEEKKKGNVTVFIYSNNGSLATLNFIGNLVNKKLNNAKFFDAIAHYDNDLRTDNTNGQYVKKWDSMKSFIDKSFNTNVRPEDVMFFDDLPHVPLHNKLDSNYVRVIPYEYPSTIINNDELLKLWKESKGDPRFIDVEDVEKTGSLPPNEEQIFLKKFKEFLSRSHRGGMQSYKLRCRRKRKMQLQSQTQKKTAKKYPKQ
jgi:hypothetical protein